MTLLGSCARCEKDLPPRRKSYCSDECRDLQKKDRDQANHLLNRYGLTVQEYQTLLDYQGHACAICARGLAAGAAVDHDHTTGITRGILCFRCNRRLLPASGDRPELHIAAAEYLASPPAVRLLGVRIGVKAVLKGVRRRKKKRRPPTKKAGK